MFALVYRWKVRPGCESRFVEAWRELTEAIAAENGSLGSRLHLCEDGTYMAYAAWPSRERWDQSVLATERARRCREIMTECAERLLPDMRAELVCDRLLPEGFGKHGTRG